MSFIMYDLVSEESYTDRHAEMESIFKGLESQYVGILDYTDYISHDEMYARLHKVRAKGYEGLMLKLNGKGYEEGFRSSYILKVKAFMDDEFEVVSIATSPDGWGICTCKIKDNLTVDVLAPGTHADKINVANNPSDYIGRKLTVQFANYTIDGKPFQPIALRWHDVI